MDTKIMIGVSTAELGRYAAFYDYFNLLDKPTGTVCSFTHGQSPAKSRNIVIQAALEHDCTHILLLDDDMVYPPDTIAQLLKHDLDIVGAYYLMRNYPHQGLVFDYAEDDGKCRWYEVKEGESGIKEVVATGLGCIMFKTHIFEFLEQPWVRLGEIEADGWCDDIGLFKRIREAGFKIHVDLDLQIGHISNVIVKPILQNGIWHVSYSTFGSEAVAFPMIRKETSDNTASRSEEVESPA